MDKIQTVKIEKISDDLSGIARIDGYVIFVENALPDEVVKIEIIKENKNFARAKIIEILEPSKYREKPFCPIYNACGACSFQHAQYNYQLALKKQIVQDAFHNIADIDFSIAAVEPSPQTRGFRAKVQYPVAQTKVSKRVLAGYYKPKTHEIVNIKHCPMQPEICDKIVEFIRESFLQLGCTCYDEKTKNGELRHIVIRHSVYTNKNLVVLVVNNNEISSNIKLLAESIYNNFEDVSGVCVNFNTKKSNLILDKISKLVIGKETVEEKLCDKIFEIGANTFFQVNPKSAENIFQYVKAFLSNNTKDATVLDAYAGIASFGIVVSDVVKKVISVEENENSVLLAKKIIKNSNINSVEVISSDTGHFMETTEEKFDVTIIDPPRKGCDKTSLDGILKLCNEYIIYVSCNPATLARDVKYLTQNGLNILSIKPFDMFCHTNHVETVVILKK